MKLTSYLPWPDKGLSPNARGHWAKRAKLTKAARQGSAWQLLQDGIRTLHADRAKVTMTFYPPDARVRDLDNMVSATKAHRDGIADVIGIDDSKWEVSFSLGGPVRPAGMVKVEIEPL